MKKIIKEFKEFISKGNIFDMAIGLIVGSAFTAIVNSLVGDIFSPLLTIVTSKADLTALAWNINGAQIKYGSDYHIFINRHCSFLPCKRNQQITFPRPEERGSERSSSDNKDLPILSF